MRSNFRTFLPPKFKDYTCPNPPDYAVERVKIQKKEKNELSKDNRKIHNRNLSKEASILTASKMHKNRNSCPLT